mgnify:CR=1 FL=1
MWYFTVFPFSEPLPPIKPHYIMNILNKFLGNYHAKPLEMTGVHPAATLFVTPINKMQHRR